MRGEYQRDIEKQRELRILEATMIANKGLCKARVRSRKETSNSKSPTKRTNVMNIVDFIYKRR